MLNKHSNTDNFGNRRVKGAFESKESRALNISFIRTRDFDRIRRYKTEMFSF